MPTKTAFTLPIHDPQFYQNFGKSQGPSYTYSPIQEPTTASGKAGDLIHKGFTGWIYGAKPVGKYWGQGRQELSRLSGGSYKAPPLPKGLLSHVGGKWGLLGVGLDVGGKVLKMPSGGGYSPTAHYKFQQGLLPGSKEFAQYSDYMPDNPIYKQSSLSGLLKEAASKRANAGVVKGVISLGRGGGRVVPKVVSKGAPIAPKAAPVVTKGVSNATRVAPKVTSKAAPAAASEAVPAAAGGFKAMLGKNVAPAALNSYMAYNAADSYDAPGSPWAYAGAAGLGTLLTRKPTSPMFSRNTSGAYRDLIARPTQRLFAAGELGEMADKADPSGSSYLGSALRGAGMLGAGSSVATRLGRIPVGGDKNLAKFTRDVLREGAANSKTPVIGRIATGLSRGGLLGQNLRHMGGRAVRHQFGRNAGANAALAAGGASLIASPSLDRAANMRQSVNELVSSDMGQAAVKQFMPEAVRPDGTVDSSVLMSPEGMQRLGEIFQYIYGTAQAAGYNNFGDENYFVNPENWERLAQPGAVADDYINRHGLLNIVKNSFR